MEAWRRVGMVLAQDDGVGGDEHEEHRILECGEGKLGGHKGEEASEDQDGIGVAGYGGAQHDQISCKQGGRGLSAVVGIA